MRVPVANPDSYIPSGEYNPHAIKPYLIANEYGALAIAYGSHEAEALDEATDADLLKGLSIDEEDLAEAEENESVIWAGNASEPLDGDNLSITMIANRAPGHFTDMPWEDDTLTDAEKLYRNLYVQTSGARYRGMDWELCLFGQLYDWHFPSMPLLSRPNNEHFERLATVYDLEPAVLRRIYILSIAKDLKDDWHEALEMCRALLIEDAPIADVLLRYRMDIWEDYCA